MSEQAVSERKAPKILTKPAGALQELGDQLAFHAKSYSHFLLAIKHYPKEIVRLETEREAAQARQRQAAAEPRRMAEQRRELENERTGLLAARKSRQEQRARLAAWIRDVTAEQIASEKRLAAR